MPRTRHDRWSAAALAAVAIAGFAAVLIADWPGHFPPDAISELVQGRSGVFNLWHPPVTAWLLGLADRLSPDAAAFVVLDAALFFTTLAAFAFVGRPGWPAVIALALIAASPLALIYQGLVVKDVLFANAAIAAFAALAWAVKLWERRALRLALISLAFVFLILAALARQNGALVAGVGCATLAAIAAGKAKRRRRVRSFAIAGATSALFVTLCVMSANQAFVAHSDHRPEEARQWMTLQLYDLAGEVRREPAAPLAVLDRQAPGLAAFVRRQAAPAYDVTRADPLLGLAAWKSWLTRPTPSVSRQWRASAFASPGLYLRSRWDVFWQVLATPHVDACAPVLVGVDPGNPRMLAAAGLVARDTDRDDWDGDYASAFLKTPVFSHLAWGGLALILLALAARDVASGRRPEMVATVGLILAAIIFAASFFVLSLACDYRYLYFVDVAAMAALMQRLSARGEV